MALGIFASFAELVDKVAMGGNYVVKCWVRIRTRLPGQDARSKYPESCGRPEGSP